MYKLINKIVNCKSISKILIIGLIFLISIAFLLTFYSYQNYKNYQAYQKNIASQTITATANNIAVYMKSLKTSLEIYVDGNREQLAQLLDASQQSPLYHKINQQLKAYFPDYYAFTVASNTGQLFSDGFGDDIGGACRNDIREFALSHDRVEAYIHPGPARYHFDVMLNWQYQHNNKIFFASFDLRHISRLLRNAQLSGHKLVLLRSDKPELIEVSSELNPAAKPPQKHLSNTQQQRILARQPVADTRWILVDIADHKLFSRYLKNMVYQDLVIFSVFVLIFLLMIIRLAQEEHRRNNAEQKLQTSHLQLEKTVQKRTRALEISLNRLQKEVEKSNKFYSAIEQTGDIVIITDNKGVVEYVNPAFEAITGYTAKDVIGNNLNILKSGKQSTEFYEKMWAELNQGHIFHGIFINHRKDDQVYYEEKTISPIRNKDGQITHYISTGKDMTEKVRTEQRIQHLAYHDALTKLPNRLLFQDRLEHAMSQASRCNTILAIFFIDLDSFKVINDSLGHATGDIVLQVISERLVNTVRESDTIARLGGDEFGLVLENSHHVDEITSMAQRIIKEIKQPIVYKDQTLHTTASIGITLFPFEDSNMEDLLKQADIAMYRAKQFGGNAFKLYSPRMGETATRRMVLINHVRNALHKQEFKLHYQPRINLEQGHITGAEALLRWNSPELGNIPPDEFIPLLEESGQIIEVGKWILEQACKDFSPLQKNMRLAVNFSPRQFSDPNLLGDIEKILHKTGFNPRHLDIEVTESLLAEDHIQLLGILNSLHGKGIQISIDDFGTGYSSLSYLKDFPIDCLKIDRSFVTNLEQEPANLKLINAIISMAHSLNMTVVTEGIETREQLDILQQQHSEEGQGYYFSPPVCLEDYLQWVHSYNTRKEKNIAPISG